MVKVVIYLAKTFGLDVIAEGVETEAQRDFLKENRCQQAQGSLFGKPMRAQDFARQYFSAPRSQIA